MKSPFSFARLRSRRQLRCRSRSWLEELELRILLSVNPTLTDTTVTFDVAAESGLIKDIPEVHLRTNASGELEWSRSADGSWSKDMDSGKSGRQTLVLGDEESVSVVLRVDGLTEIVDVFNNLFENPISGVFLHDLFTGGADLSVRATKIRVTDGSTVSTHDIDPTSVDPPVSPGLGQQTGSSHDDSGNLKFNAPKIVLSSASAVVAHADGGKTPGSVTMTAIGSLDDVTSSLVTLPLLPNVTITSATVDMTGAKVTGGDITIKAESDSADLFDDGSDVLVTAVAEEIPSQTASAKVTSSQGGGPLTFLNASATGVSLASGLGQGGNTRPFQL